MFDTTDGVDTLQFIEAAQGLVGIFSFMNKSMILSQVQDDLNGNITKVRTRYEANESTSKTLEKLVENEKAALKNAQENKTEKFLSVLIRKVLQGDAQAAPPHVDETSFHVGPPPAKRTVTDEERKTLEEQLDKSLAGLSSIYTRLESFYIAGRHDKGFSVTNGFQTIMVLRCMVYIVEPPGSLQRHAIATMPA
ncbi:hypothetical protein B0H14DRAFT_3721523 [Mycena olivaceomarginata]|nr:hypothetical protein B0H14DRAFT_3721523 [Mycena olivaceomarginata]